MGSHLHGETIVHKGLGCGGVCTERPFGCEGIGMARTLYGRCLYLCDEMTVGKGGNRCIVYCIGDVMVYWKEILVKRLCVENFICTGFCTGKTFNGEAFCVSRRLRVQKGV